MNITYVREPEWRNRLRYGLDGRGSIPVEARIFSLLDTSDRFLDPPSLLLSGCRCSFPGVKMPARELNHSPPPNAEVKNEWSHASTSPAYLFIFSSVDVNKIFSTFPHSLNIYEAQKLEENNNIWILTQNPKHGFMACDPMWFLKMGTNVSQERTASIFRVQTHCHVSFEHSLDVSASNSFSHAVLP